MSGVKHLHDFLTKNNRIDKMYDAIADDDLGEVVMTAMRVLKVIQHLPPLHTVRKSEEMSEKYRNIGNAAFKSNNYQRTLMFYNRAILHAPKDSKEMKFAYSNRSALLFKVKAYKACLKDIEICFAMGCPNNIIGKLKKRKENVMGLIATEDFTLTLLIDSVEKFINTTIASNPILPCAFKDVNIIGSVTPEVVASVDIKVGTVVSREKAYVSSTDSMVAIFACHYCQKHMLNLIPCENCCFAMFCDEECRKQCNDEYHKYECYIMDTIKAVCYNANQILTLKTILKLRSKCKSWAELIDASYKMGLDRMKTSSYNEIYDCNNIYSVLNIRDDKPLIYGILYNASYGVASLVHYFGDIPSFYPKDTHEKQQAMRAVGRIMLFLSIYQTPLHIYQILTNQIDGLSSFRKLHNYGIYSFTGKLKKSCKPNLLVINNNNEQILLALRTIKCGEELTISCRQHLLDVQFDRHNRNITNYVYSGNVCDCSICTGYDTLKAKGQLSSDQREYYNGLNFNEIDECINTIHVSDAYNKLLQALDVLGDVPYSEEYEEIFKRFRRCIMFYETIKGRNFIIDLLGFVGFQIII